DAAPESTMPIFVHYSAEFPYGLPVPGTHHYKVGLHHSGPLVEPDRQDQRDDPGLSRRIEHAVRTFLPGFDPRPVAVERCIYDNSPDTDFIVDRVGNVVIGSGTSGHGFKFGPLLGEWLAALALDTAGDAGRAGAVPAVPDRFALSRFQGLPSRPGRCRSGDLRQERRAAALAPAHHLARRGRAWDLARRRPADRPAPGRRAAADSGARLGHAVSPRGLVDGHLQRRSGAHRDLLRYH